MDARVPLTTPFTMQQILNQSLWPARMAAILLGVLGALALVLASVGVYGVMAYAVAQRTREIGIRRAVGATGKHIATQFLTEAVVLTTAGGILGVLLGLGAVLFVSTFAGWNVAVTAWALLLPLAMSVMVGLFF